MNGIKRVTFLVNSILEEIGAKDKPVIIVFNKMDLYEAKNFDEFLPLDVKKSMLLELENSWMARTNENAIFVSATQNRNTGDLRHLIFEKVRKLYLLFVLMQFLHWRWHHQI